MRKFLILACLTTPAAPALAEDVFQRPADCQLMATTQRDTCEVENIYSCGAAESPIIRTESFDALGLYAVSIDDAENKSYSTDFVGEDGSFWLEYSGDEPSEVLRKGLGVSTATGEFQAFGLRRPFAASSSSAYEGQSMNLAGKSFHRIENKLSMQLPYPMPEIRGTEILAFSEEMQLGLSVEITYESDAPLVQGSKLVELSLPGQAGFGEEYPRFGCSNLSLELVTVFSKVPA